MTEYADLPQEAKDQLTEAQYNNILAVITETIKDIPQPGILQGM